MTASVWQQCDDCDARFEELDRITSCADCGGLLTIEQTPPAMIETLRQRLDASRDLSGVWRYGEMLLPSVTAAEQVSHPEGNTPLLRRAALSKWSGVADLALKHEGHNPTGSFKDRGMTAGMSQAKRLNVAAVACASTGNTSASLASYAAHADIPALVFIPEGQVALGKLIQSLAYGARTLIVKGDFDSCLALVRDAERELGIYLLNSINPYRVEGQKSIVFELLQQRQWQVPDWIVLPAGNLGNTAAFGKALLQARAYGLIDRLPRLAAVQAEGSSPFAQAFQRNFDHLVTQRAETVATAIRIGAPASYHRAVRAIRETSGVVTSVTDLEILEAKAVIDRTGIGCEPASAATLAGVRQLQQRGVIGTDESVVGILTGHLLKDPGLLQRMHEMAGPATPWANPPTEIEATVQAVEAVLRATVTG